MARGKTSCYNHTRKTFFLCATKGAKIPMTKKIRIGILGLRQPRPRRGAGRRRTTTIMELVGVFTRRDPATRAPQTPGAHGVRAGRTELAAHTDRHRRARCSAAASATDLPEQTPAAAQRYSTSSTPSTPTPTSRRTSPPWTRPRARRRHVARHLGGLGSGHVLAQRASTPTPCMPNGADYTFWGRGVSQGHSDAIRRIPGVADARQYTVPGARGAARPCAPATTRS